MTRHRVWSVVIAASILASLSLSEPVSAAQPATVSGDLISAAAKLPGSAASGSAQVMAMNVDTGAYGDADNVGRKGHYVLSLPPGTWALRTSTVTDSGYSSFLSAAIVAKSGQNRTLPLTLRKFKKPRKRHRKPRRPARAPADGGQVKRQPEGRRLLPGCRLRLQGIRSHLLRRRTRSLPPWHARHADDRRGR